MAEVTAALNCKRHEFPALSANTPMPVLVAGLRYRPARSGAGRGRLPLAAIGGARCR